MTDKIRVGVSGALGKMGRMVCDTVADDADLALVAAIDPLYRNSPAGSFPRDVPHFPDLPQALAGGEIDVVVDFTHPEVVADNVSVCVEAGVPVVVGTTGLSPKDLEGIARRSREKGTAVFVAPNFALGAVLMMQFAQTAARYLGACEIVELHHDRKADAPSGTARRSADLIQVVWQGRSLERTVPIHSVRLPGLVAHQEVIFGGLGETLTIRHDSLSRESFMPGVALAVKRVRALQGLVVGLETIL
jgi:4-hydroxy-tetrahydrodipicolinate reductase